MRKDILLENLQNIRNEDKVKIDRIHGEEYYIISPKFEQTVYIGIINELNINSLMVDKLVDPTNGIPILSDRTKWVPKWDKATNNWYYKSEVASWYKNV